jgi:uncharacterized protein YpmS
MNKWKVAFIALLIFVVAVVVYIIVMATSATEDQQVPPVNTTTGSVVEIQTTTKEFELIAQKYLADAVKNSPIPVEISVDNQMHLFAELSILGVPIPIQLDFEPVVDEGNLRLLQKNVHVGKLNVPPSTILKLVNDSVDFPSWIMVRPKNEEIYVDLSRLNIAQGNRVRAKEVDLAGDKIILELVIPTN